MLTLFKAVNRILLSNYHKFCFVFHKQDTSELIKIFVLFKLPVKNILYEQVSEMTEIILNRIYLLMYQIIL